MIHLSSPANPKVKAFAKLAEKKYRAESGLFLLEGNEFVERAVAHGWQTADVLADEGADTLLTPTITTNRSVLSKISGKDNPQPVIGILKQRWTEVPAKPQGLWLALDRPRDPGNLGTIIRTADATGVAGIVLIGDSTDPYAPECVRASMGSILHVPLARCGEDEFIVWAEGKTVLGTHLAATTDYRTLTPIHPAVLLMGNESEGLTPALANACTQTLRIPMTGHAESLNLATATALVLYHLQQHNLK